MVKEFDKKYTWVIKNFSYLESEKIYSNQFVVGGCNWRFEVFPKGNNGSNCLSLYLDIANSNSLPSGWKRHTNFSFTIVNQYQKKLSLKKEAQRWFNVNQSDWGFEKFIPLTELHAKDGGFVVNGELMIVAEVNVLEVIGKLDVTDETYLITEIVDVNGFQVPSSQVEFAKRLFDKHPNIASNLCLEKPLLKTAYMNLLFSVITTLTQSLTEISKDDLAGVSTAVVSLTAVGFKLDWIEKKLEEVKENKEKLVGAETRIHGLREKLKIIEGILLEEEKAYFLTSNASSLKLDDFF